MKQEWMIELQKKKRKDEVEGNDNDETERNNTWHNVTWHQYALFTGCVCLETWVCCELLKLSFDMKCFVIFGYERYTLWNALFLFYFMFLRICHYYCVCFYYCYYYYHYYYYYYYYYCYYYYYYYYYYLYQFFFVLWTWLYHCNTHVKNCMVEKKTKEL